jgi:hypothetical protein
MVKSGLLAEGLDKPTALGQLVKEMPIKQFGKGEMELQVNGFSSGNYNYTLFVNNQVIDTKRMVLAQQ